ncbi:transcriptional regulator, LuxR family [Conexibacter woesei DSM 14684]|uniref:Transcriptional regulator, LuxR family n=1 Tax=Conexibacter woesei (strain DSM 14684 / CCUG 47730 / CIP 108061 / JCM 11494 / NBRC 100937 / ID131577) TaxID=469383 RepID=D3FEJ7_CONWI|nr:transcriptional regulator, LuxR family [Conexibacter woesei DSM 14684]
MLRAVDGTRTALPGGRLAALTPRELEVLRLVTKGDRTARIAQQLGITEPTVKRHLTNLYRRLDVTNRVQAATYYVQHAPAG